MTDKLHKWENCKFNNPPTQKQYNSRIATKENEVLHLSFLESSTVRSFLCLFSINITCYFFFTVFQQKTARRQSDGDKFHGPKRQGTDINFSLFNNL